MPASLPSDTRLGAVVLEVASLERSREYYGSVLGLRAIGGEAGAGLALGAAGGDEPLVILRERPGARPVPRRGLLGLFHFAILLPDRAALGRLLVHLAERRERFGASDHRVSEALYLTDPDGLGIEIYADRPRDEWRTVNGELQMTTAALDADAVVATSQGVRWEGMPGAARMGHLHLHVGDLAEASRFYHEAIGFQRTVWSYPGALFLAAGGYHHHLGLNTWAAGARAATEGDARLVEWRVELPGEEALAAVRARTSAAGSAMTTDGVIADPWGTQLRISCA